MRKTLLAVLLAATGAARAENVMTALVTTEASNEWRLQHAFGIKHEAVTFAGHSNLDVDASGTLNRVQIKPRVSLGIDGPWRLTLQQEWFWSRIEVQTPRGELVKHIRFDATRIGIGHFGQWEGLRNELNLYLRDTQSGGARLEVFTFGKLTDRWSVTNQFWRDFSAATSFNQVSLQWRMSPDVSLALQHNVLTGKAPVYRVGICVNF